MKQQLVSVKNLKHTFHLRNAQSGVVSYIEAIRGVDLEIFKGETLGLVGESGSGKSTLGRCILRLIKPTSGEISYAGKDLLALSDQELKLLRRQIQIIFQDPYSSLNPKMTVEDLLEEPLIVHSLLATSAQRMKRVEKLLDLVGLSKDALTRYPHEFSGGQRQRISIARALAVDPEFIVCDEPVSALDVSVQAQILNLLLDLQNELKLTYLFISHDLRVIRYMCHRVCVMYKGEIVERGESESLFLSPQAPYTKDLLSAIPGTTF